MLTRILPNSERLCDFFDHLELDLYKPQRQHSLNIADALLVCEDDKTVAALQRQFVQAQHLPPGVRHAAHRRHHGLIRVGAGLEKCV